MSMDNVDVQGRLLARRGAQLDRGADGLFTLGQSF